MSQKVKKLFVKLANFLIPYVTMNSDNTFLILVLLFFFLNALCM